MGLFGLKDLLLNMKINQFIMENGILKLIKDMVGGFNVGQMEVDMKDIGVTIERMLEESYIMGMEIFMKVDG
jgi:predicted transport protein